MLKSMRSVPVPQPPAADNAWMMPSDVPLFGSVETSVFHGFGAWKSWPGTVVVGAEVVVVVVLGRVVDVLAVDDVMDDEELLEVDAVVVVDVLDVVGTVASVVDVDVEVVVGGSIVVDVEVVVVLGFDVDVLDVDVLVDDDVLADVEVLDDVEDDEVVERGAVEVVVVGMVGRVVEVLVVTVEVVVVFLLWPLNALAQLQPMHGSPAQSAEVSHSSPAPGSSRPSPQTEAAAVSCRRFAPRLLRVAVRVVQAGVSTCALSRTWRRVPQVVQRRRMVSCPSPRVMRTRARGQSAIVATLAYPSGSTTMASKGSAPPETSAGSTRKRTPGHGAATPALAGAPVVTSASSKAHRKGRVDVAAAVRRRRAAGGCPIERRG